MRLVPLNSVQEGVELAKTIYDNQGRVLLSKGIILKGRLLQRIEANGIMSIYINDEYSEGEIEDIIDPQMRQRAIKTMKDSFGRLSDIATGKVSSSKKASKMKQEYIDSIHNIINEFIEQIFTQKDIMVKMVDIKTMDNYTYEHCVNVAVLSLIIGVEMKFNKIKLLNLATGAILHDLGKTFIPKNILLKKGKLNDEEYEIIKDHSRKGYEYLKDNMYINATSRVVALQHHERVDGKGYPKGISGDEINECAKVVAVADVYDALTSDRVYRKAMSPNEALEYIMGGSDTHFDYEVVKAFTSRIVPYPEGTLVGLSNGDIAVVKEMNDRFALRPRIKIVKSQGDFNKDDMLDLMEHKSITIKGVVYNV